MSRTNPETEDGAGAATDRAVHRGQRIVVDEALGRQKTSRFYILDLVRLLAILTMIQGHTLHALVSPDINVFPWNVWSFMRGLTAPVFLIVSGAVQIFANRRDGEGKLLGTVIFRRTRWFLFLLAVGYAMCLPSELLHGPEHVSEAKWDLLFRVHILQLIGVTGLIYLGVMALTRSNGIFAIVALAIGAGLITATPIVHSLDAYAVMPKCAANYFGAPGHFGRDTLFPIFPFSAYMFLGAGLGWIVKRAEPDKRIALFVRTTLFAGLLLTAAGTPEWIRFESSAFWWTNPWSMILRAGLALLGMTLVGLIYPLIRRFESLFARLGKKALHIFVAHLLILYGGPGFGGLVYTLSIPLALIEGIGVALFLIAVCVVGALILDAIQRRLVTSGS